MPTNKRGKNKGGNNKSIEICSKIHDYIESFNVIETHYGGKPKKYHDARWNVKIMHEMFISENADMMDVFKYNFY